MIDKALIGAIERAFERNEPREFIRHSLISSGYIPQDVDEAINLVMYKKQQKPEILPALQQKPKQILKEPRQFSISRNVIMITILSLLLILSSVFFLYLLPKHTSCNTLGLPDLKKDILGIGVTCNQLNIIYIESIVVSLTILALLIVVIYLFIKKKE